MSVFIPVPNKDYTRSVFTSIPKKENGKESFNYCVFVLISNASKVMLRILQAMSRQYVNTRTSRCTSLGFEEAEEPDIKILNICWIREKEREFHKKSTAASSTMLKSFTVWIATNCGKLLKKWKYQTTLPIS